MNIIQRIILAFAIMFTIMSTTAYADPLDNLTQDDGIAAFQAIDAMGLEVIPRSELEEVRGEPLNPELYNTAVREVSLDKFLQTEIAKKFSSEISTIVWNSIHNKM